MTTLRIRADVLDETGELFIDATVDSIDIEKTVHLSDVDSDRTWTTTLDQIERAQDRNKAVAHADLVDPDHQLWASLETVYAMRDDDTISDELTADIESSFDDFFNRIVAEQSRVV